MNKDSYIGIDLGGTNIRAGMIRGEKIIGLHSKRIDATASVDEVLVQIFDLTDGLLTDTVKGIGIGVPGLVDASQGMVYDVVNIPSWKAVPLQRFMEERYNLPVVMNNDANCFALAEFYFGKGRDHPSFLALTIGTGLGSGIIVNGRLYSGAHGGAGEFGMIDYLDRYYEYYASGQFFQNCYQLSGEEVFQRAENGDTKALRMFEEMGGHLGNAIKTILYALDVDLIILGGSVSRAFPFFCKSMWNNIRKLAFKNPAENIRIEVSELENGGVLGAAALCYDRESISR